MSTPEIQDSSKSARKSLKTLQHTSDQENLVGRVNKSLKHQLQPQEATVEVEVKRKNLSTKETQAALDTLVTVEDLTNPEKASENYWKVLAEKRQSALEEALEENEKLLKIIEDLKEDNRVTKQMLEEANSLIEVVKEELVNDSNDDTGIDINDVSQEDESDEQSK